MCKWYTGLLVLDWAYKAVPISEHEENVLYPKKFLSTKFSAQINSMSSTHVHWSQNRAESCFLLISHFWHSEKCEMNTEMYTAYSCYHPSVFCRFRLNEMKILFVVWENSQNEWMVYISVAACRCNCTYHDHLIIYFTLHQWCVFFFHVALYESIFIALHVFVCLLISACCTDSITHHCWAVVKPSEDLTSRSAIWRFVLPFVFFSANWSKSVSSCSSIATKSRAVKIPL